MVVLEGRRLTQNADREQLCFGLLVHERFDELVVGEQPIKYLFFETLDFDLLLSWRALLGYVRVTVPTAECLGGLFLPLLLALGIVIANLADGAQMYWV